MTKQATTAAASSPPPKSLWPRIIIGVFSLFAAWLVTSVMIMSHQDVELVTKNYYTQELSYQSRIDAHNRSKALEVGVKVGMLPEKSMIQIQFPESFQPNSINGQVHVYRPSDAKLDFRERISLTDDGQHLIDAKNLASGMWKVIVDWEVDGVDYFDEVEVLVE